MEDAMLRTSLSSSTTFTPSKRYYQDYQKKNIPQTKPTLLIKINTALASLVKLVMMSHVSRSYLVSKHLCEAEHISTQLNCSSARDHAISFMLFPLKSHPSSLVLLWLPYSRISVESLRKGWLASRLAPFLSLLISPVTQEGFLLVTVIACSLS